MKKSLILLAIIILITGCNQEIKEKTQNNSKNNQPHDFRKPDFGEPDRKPEILGIVKSVVGNEMTIIEIEMPNFERNKNTENETEKTPTFGAGLNSGEQGMHGGMRGGMGGNKSEEDKNNLLEMLKERSIAESTVVIPVGIQMLKPEMASETKEITIIEANVADVKKDQMVSVWLNKDVEDRKIAEFVLIK